MGEGPSRGQGRYPIGDLWRQRKSDLLAWEGVSYSIEDRGESECPIGSVVEYLTTMTLSQQSGGHAFEPRMGLTFCPAYDFVRLRAPRNRSATAADCWMGPRPRRRTECALGDPATLAKRLSPVDRGSLAWASNPHVARHSPRGASNMLPKVLTRAGGWFVGKHCSTTPVPPAQQSKSRR